MRYSKRRRGNMFEGFKILNDCIDSINDELYGLIMTEDIDAEDVFVIEEEINRMKNVIRLMGERLKRL